MKEATEIRVTITLSMEMIPHIFGTAQQATTSEQASGLE